MSSEGNQMNDGTSFQPSEPALCANGCGFFGSAATMNLCSKCYRDVHMKEEQTAKAKKAFEKFVSKNKEEDASLEPSSGLAVAKPSSSAVAAEEPRPDSGADLGSAANNGGVGKKTANRCFCCNKKVGVMGFTCRCESTFCGTHRYPEKHNCSFDFKAQGRESIAKENPVVKADKIQRI